MIMIILKCLSLTISLGIATTSIDITIGNTDWITIAPCNQLNSVPWLKGILKERERERKRERERERENTVHATIPVRYVTVAKNLVEL